MSKLLKWQLEYIEHVEGLSNNDLLDEVLSDVEYFGDRGTVTTDKDEWKYNWIYNELRIRLEKIGFLEEDK